MQLKMKALSSGVVKALYIDFSDVQRQLCPQSMVGSGRILKSSKTIWLSSLPAKRDDPIKNGGARVFTTVYIDFLDDQGQRTQGPVLGSGRNLNLYMLSCLSSLNVKNEDD